MLLELYTFSRIIEIYENVEKKTQIRGTHNFYFVFFFHYLILFSYLEILFIEGVSCMN